MDNEIKQRADEYIELYQHVSKTVSDAEAVAAIIESIGKDKRVEILVANGRSNCNSNGDEPASDKQLNFLAKLGINVPEQCCKREASKLIDEKLSA